MTDVTSPVQRYLHQLHSQFSSLGDGNVASYIPQLSKANPDWFGICLVTADGQVYEVGDTERPFTIQSISKAFTYGLALEANGLDGVHRKVSVEPSGDTFNSISLKPTTGIPFNPMINAGAIAVTGMVPGDDSEAKMHRILETYSRYAGRPLTLDLDVYRSECETGDRNRAIAWMLRNFGIIDPGTDPMMVLDAYFQQCSIALTCRDLAVMGASLGNSGINPLSGERCLSSDYVTDVLSVMGTCGMYNYAGEWLFRVGLPAKSGVGGGIVAVLPGRLGIAVFSPPLDERGNSVRGLAVCEELSEAFNLHLFDEPPPTTPFRSVYDASHVSSHHLRPAVETQILQQQGPCIRVLELQGTLVFATIEQVIRQAIADLADFRYVIVDLKYVLGVDTCACQLLSDLVDIATTETAGQLLFAYVETVPCFNERMVAIAGDRWHQTSVFADIDAALDWCESQLLATVNPSAELMPSAVLADQALVAGMSSDILEQLAQQGNRRSYRTGDIVLMPEESLREVFFIIRGMVQAQLAGAYEQTQRLITISAGMAFNEAALVSGPRPFAEIRAVEDTTCLVVSTSVFETLAIANPQFKIDLLSNLSRSLLHRLARSQEELCFLTH